MGRPIESTFNRYALTDEEQITGAQLTSSQKFIIQNQLADIADQILSLDYEPSDPLQFAIQHSFLKGQMAVYRHMLDASDAANKVMLDLARGSQS